MPRNFAPIISQLPLVIVAIIIGLLVPRLHGNPGPDLPSGTTSCPPWTVLTSFNKCECRSDLHRNLIYCDNATLDAFVKTEYCMTYSEDFNITVLGKCSYLGRRMISRRERYFGYYFWYRIPFNYTTRYNSLCDGLQQNRTGQLCGRCKENYSLPVYSYSLGCVKCSDYRYNWLWYLAVAFFPLTLFYFIIILFKFSLNSGVLSGFILVCQILTAPILMRIVFHNKYPEQSNSYALNILVTFHAIWNLDFFRSQYPPFCLSPSLSTLQTISLEYLIAVYPMFLILITYVCERLNFYYGNVLLFKPFQWCFRKIEREWNIRTFLVGAFGTFLLLSYVKILNTSLDLLAPVQLYDLRGQTLDTQYLYIDGTVKYFGREHLPYALLAITTLVVFNIVPLVLFSLYPCFQKCFSLNTTVTEFVNPFNAHYKAKPDFRYFAGLNSFVRIFFLALYCLTAGSQMYFPLSGTITLWIAFLYVVFQPFEKRAANIMNMFFLMCLALLFFLDPIQSYLTRGIGPYNTWHVFNVLYQGSLISALLIFDTVYFTYRIVPKRVKDFITYKVKPSLSNCLDHYLTKVSLLKQKFGKSLPHDQESEINENTHLI